MDGIKISSTDRARSWTIVGACVLAISVAPLAHGQQPLTTLEPITLQPYSGANGSLSPVTAAQLRRRAHGQSVSNLRPPARVIDARQSPMVAVVGSADSESDSEIESTDEGSPASIQDERSNRIDSDRPLGTSSSSDRQPTVEEALAIRGSVTFRNTPISEVVFLLSDLWKINIVAGADVTGDVSGAFQNAPLSEVLSAALTASGYGYRQMGSSLVVLPIDQIGAASNSGAATGFSESGIAYFTPQFTDAAQMAVPLQQALGVNVIVAVYPEENRIMIKGSSDDLRIAAEAIQQLDVPRPQVRITAMIYDVSLGELERIGVTWNRQVREIANGTDEALAEVTRSVGEFFATSSNLTTTGATSIGIRTISNSLDASMFLEALDVNTEAKLLADPSITVGDRTEASIRIVQQIPIIGANPVAGSNAVFTQTQFKEAGVILKVMPRISRDGTIQLQVQPEYSVVSEITATGPVIDTRTADTIVRVNDGQMFVLGGLRQKSIVESVTGVPYLRDLRYIGKLFRSHQTEVQESELIVFLKPEIITPYYPGHAREQMAACVASDQLDRIPHAQTCSMIPCCKYPQCPNHHPRWRPNLGSYSVEMIGGCGLGSYEIVEPDMVGIAGERMLPNLAHDELLNPDIEDAIEMTMPSSLEPTVVEELYPPVHIDPRAIPSVTQ